MIDYYCWFRDIRIEDYLKILADSSICNENNCRYNENNNELCTILSQRELHNNHVDDIFKDLESIVEKKLECHIKVHNFKIRGEISVIQENGYRSIIEAF